MNNVIHLKPRQRVKYRRRAMLAASGTNGGACGYFVLLAFWPETFAYLIIKLLVAAAVLVTNGVWLHLHGQDVRLRREAQARRREYQASERARVRASWNAPTEPHPIHRPNHVVSQTTYEPVGGGPLEDRLKLRILTDLTEHTGDIAVRRTA